MSEHTRPFAPDHCDLPETCEHLWPLDQGICPKCAREVAKLIGREFQNPAMASRGIEGTVMDEIINQPQITDDGAWTCQHCHIERNFLAFCRFCGSPRP